MAQLQELEIVKRIEQARIESGLSQDEMADLLEVASRTYWNYENSRVPYKLMGRISDVTGRSLRWLLHGEEDAEPSAQVMQRLAVLESKIDILLGREGGEGNPRRRAS
jgi:transcriptional regulator with XRE-family HTH domain